MICGCFGILRLLSSIWRMNILHKDLVGVGAKTNRGRDTSVFLFKFITEVDVCVQVEYEGRICITEIGSDLTLTG